MSRLHLLSVPILAATLIALAATSADAQTYTRTEDTATYVTREGGAQTPVWTSTDIANGGGRTEDDAAKFTRLPFDFPFFDRVYRGCYLNTNGAVVFDTFDVDDFGEANITAPVGDRDQHNTIHVYRSDLYSGHIDDGTQLMAFVEDDRVVIQWRDTPFFSGERLCFINFQAHLFADGRIILHYGPETNFIEDHDDFNSGIVNHDGSVSFAGFGNVTTIQDGGTERPANGRRVTLTPSGFTPVDALMISHTSDFAADGSFARTLVENDAPVAAQFEVTPIGAGGTLNSLQFTLPGGHTYRLFRDVAPFGEVDTSDTEIASSTNGTFTGLTEAITTESQRYIMLVEPASSNLGAGQFYLREFSGSGTSGTVPVYGAYSENPTRVIREPFILENGSGLTNAPAAVAPGDTDVAVGSFVLTEQLDAPVTASTLNGLDISLFGNATSYENVRLYLDNGTIGVFDGDDTLLFTATDPVTSTISMTGLAETVTIGQSDRRAFLVVADIPTSVATNTTIGLQSLSNYSVTNAYGNTVTITSLGGFGSLRVEGDPAQVLTGFELASTDIARIDQLFGATDLLQAGFVLRTSNGTADISELVAIATGVNFENVRLYRDNGDGVFTLGSETMVAAGTLSTLTWTFPALTETVDTAGTAYYVVADILATGASSGGTQFTVPFTSITTTAASTDSVTITGINYDIQDDTLPGLDVSIAMRESAAVGGQDQVVIADITVTPRGAGGVINGLQFVISSTERGMANLSALGSMLMIDLNNNGVLDAADIPAWAGTGTFGPVAFVQLLDDSNTDLATEIKLFAVVFRQPGVFPTAGTAEISLFGTSEINTSKPVRLTSYNFRSTNVTVSIDSVGSGSGGDDGCVYRANGNGLLHLLAGLLIATIGLGLVRRRA